MDYFKKHLTKYSSPLRELFAALLAIVVVMVSVVMVNICEDLVEELESPLTVKEEVASTNLLDIVENMSERTTQAEEDGMSVDVDATVLLNDESVDEDKKKHDMSIHVEPISISCTNKDYNP